MYIRKFGYSLAALILALAAGCKPAAPKTDSAGNSPAGPSTLPPLVARLHWLGKKRISADPHAAQVMKVWGLPESLKVEAQSIERLAQAPIRWLGGSDTNMATVTNGPFASLKPLAEDLLQQESFWEILQASNESRITVVAVRLGETRASFWQTNLASALEVITGQRTVTGSRGNEWSLQLATSARAVGFARSGPWAIVAIEPATASKTNSAVGEFVRRIERSQVPYAPRTTNFWLEGEVDLARLASDLPAEWVPAAGFPYLTLNVVGDNQGVRGVGQLTFAKPLGFEIQKWNIPTNLIHDPLSSFTAVQGAGYWLASIPAWNRVMPGFAPSQIFWWAQGRLPIQNYMAVIAPDSSNRLAQLSEYLLQQGNAWIASNSFGQFERQSNGLGVAWVRVPFADPHLELSKDGAIELIFGGLGAPAVVGRTIPPELQYQVVGNPKLVAYDWEMTGQRIEGWLFASQLARLLMHKAQVPPESASVAWLKNLEEQLGNCGTVVTRTGPAQLTFVRRSTIGLSALELNLFADWLESPNFPLGLTTFTAPPPPPFKHAPRAANP